MLDGLGVAFVVDGASSQSFQGLLATPGDDADMRAWVRHLESRIDAVRSELSAERKRVDERLLNERQQTQTAIADLRGAIDQEMQARHAALRDVSLNGVAVAAVGAFCSLLGLFLAWS